MQVITPPDYSNGNKYNTFHRCMLLQLHDRAVASRATPLTQKQFTPPTLTTVRAINDYLYSRATMASLIWYHGLSLCNGRGDCLDPPHHLNFWLATQYFFILTTVPKSSTLKPFLPYLAILLSFSPAFSVTTASSLLQRLYVHKVLLLVQEGTSDRRKVPEFIPLKRSYSNSLTTSIL